MSGVGGVNGATGGTGVTGNEPGHLARVHVRVEQRHELVQR